MPGKSKAKKVNYLVCVNSEEYSRVALRFACHMAKKNKGSVIVLHVMEPVDYQSFGTVAEKMRQELREKAEKLLQSLAEMSGNESGITPVLLVREGLIEEEIISVVKEDDSINMLLVGSAPESSNKSKILPPLVAQSGNKLQIPILIVPGNLTSQQIEALT